MNSISASAAAIDEIVDLARRAVVHGYRVAVAFHVQDQVFTHNCEADQANVCFFFHLYKPFILMFDM